MSISSAAMGFRVEDDDVDESFSFADDELEYRPSTRLERHHAPTRWRGILCGSLDRHLSSGSIAPDAKITSRTVTEDLSLLLLLRNGTAEERLFSVSASLVTPSAISNEDTAAVGIATDADPSNPELLLLLFSDISFVTSAAAARAAAAWGGGGVVGNADALNPLDAILPNIHMACSYITLSGLDSNDTIIGTASG